MRFQYASVLCDSVHFSMHRLRTLFIQIAQLSSESNDIASVNGFRAKLILDLLSKDSLVGHRRLKCAIKLVRRCNIRDCSLLIQSLNYAIKKHFLQCSDIIKISQLIFGSFLMRVCSTHQFAVRIVVISKGGCRTALDGLLAGHCKGEARTCGTQEGQGSQYRRHSW